MKPAKHASRKRRWLFVMLFLLALPFRLLIAFLRALFFSPKPKKPIGYWARDERGRWELRIPAYDINEDPPYDKYRKYRKSAYGQGWRSPRSR